MDGIKIAENPESEMDIWQISKFTTQKKIRIARLTVLGMLHFDIAGLYGLRGYNKQHEFHFSEAKKIAIENNDQVMLSFVYLDLAFSGSNLNNPDSSLSFLKMALKSSELADYGKYRSAILEGIGRIYLQKREYELAKKYFSLSAQLSLQQNNLNQIAQAYESLSNLFISTGKADLSLDYAKKSFEISETTGSPSGMLNSCNWLSYIYKLRNNVDSAFKYQSLAMIAKDSLINEEKIKQFQNIGFDEQLRLRQLEEEKAAFQNRVRTFAMLAGLSLFVLIALILYRNNRQKQKANVVLEKTLSNLKSARAQLIQSEKMASLGELTAGIAHEIQNPLNFVNNFSEVNTELMAEMKNEMLAGNQEEAISLADNIIENEQKINHHGKRADAIVKGMLQHSRSSTGQKEPTDINALADEYLRLSYHGLRAKDKTFNASMQTDFDESIGKINIIPQDIGRVLLNLYNNAFYAVNEKKKQQGENYEPIVSVSTKKTGNKVEIHVEDNGNGIPKKVFDKIFQPFFTTKPAGQGTGLGLSLSYDIITKEHSGTIKAETKEGEFAEFIIELPIA